MYFLSELIELLATVTVLFLYLYALNLFFFFRRTKLSMVCLSLLAAVFVGSTYLFRGLESNLYASILGLICMIGISMLCFTGTPMLRGIMPFLYNLLDIVIANLVFFFYHNFFHADILTELKEGNYGRLSFLLTLYLLEFVILFFIPDKNKNETANSPSRQILPMLFFIADFCIILLSHYAMHYLHVQDNRFLTVCVCISLLTIMCTILFLFLFQRMQTQEHRTHEASLLSVQLAEQERRLLLQKEDNEKIRVLRHDMKNYLLNYKVLLEKGNKAEVLSDIQQKLEQQLFAPDIVYTSNPLLNAVLLSASSTCKEENIHFKARVVIPASYQNIDIMVAISNLISNAIEHERTLPEKDRLVTAEITQLPAGLSVLITNNIMESILEKNRGLMTSKANPNLHGYGLKSVKAIVSRNNGLIDIYEENHMFCVHFFLPISRTAFY